jgi:hypothetical protein
MKNTNTIKAYSKEYPYKENTDLFGEQYKLVGKFLSIEDALSKLTPGIYVFGKNKTEAKNCRPIAKLSNDKLILAFGQRWVSDEMDTYRWSKIGI